MATMSSSASFRSLRSASARKLKPAVVFSRSRNSKRQKDQREQVAAVCFRIHDGRLEFLLVQTRRSGRWIFPKGGVEPGLTRSQSAAQEALEEAGVHGSIEEAPFSRYAAYERGSRRTSSDDKSMIAAYLCAVAWLTLPQEANRNPTWFSPEEAKKRLAQYRERRFARELCRVVDRAVMRVERLQNCAFAANDPLRRTTFEAPGHRFAYSDWKMVPPARPVLPGFRLAKQSAVVDVRTLAPAHKTLLLGPATDLRRGLPFAQADRGHELVRQKKRRIKETRTLRS
jgi:8-oxo-dGTP pyrophosphatase MutT (NUDIX family)